MKNVSYEVRDGKLVITLDPTQRFGQSNGKAKSEVVSSSGGFISIPECGIALNLMAIVPKAK